MYRVNYIKRRLARTNVHPRAGSFIRVPRIVVAVAPTPEQTSNVCPVQLLSRFAHLRTRRRTPRADESKTFSVLGRVPASRPHRFSETLCDPNEPSISVFLPCFQVSRSVDDIAVIDGRHAEGSRQIPRRLVHLCRLSDLYKFSPHG
jgi:hypothetical protein